MGSTVVRMRDGDPEPSSLALVAGLAVRHAVAARLAGDRVPLLKWPNDVMIAQAKLAGILLERIGEAIVIGIGVNLVSSPDLADRRTVSLAELGATVDRDSFAADLASALALDLDRWRMFGLAPIVERWQQVAHPIATPLLAGEPGEVPLAGEFGGLAADGALQLRLPDGTTRIINAGEVRLAGTSG